MEYEFQPLNTSGLTQPVTVPSWTLNGTVKNTINEFALFQLRDGETTKPYKWDSSSYQLVNDQNFSSTINKPTTGKPC